MPLDARPLSIVRDVAELKRKFNQLRLGTGNALLPCSQQGSSYTLTLSDAETCVEMTSASATTVTVPPHSSVAFPVGAWVEVRQFGAGQVTLAQGSGVTIHSPNGATKTCSQYTTVVLHQRATDEWVLVGDLV